MGNWILIRVGANRHRYEKLKSNSWSNSSCLMSRWSIVLIVGIGQKMTIPETIVARVARIDGRQYYRASLSSWFYLLLASRRSYFVALSLSPNLPRQFLRSLGRSVVEQEYQKCVFTSVPVHKATSRLILIHSPLRALSHARIRPT